MRDTRLPPVFWVIILTCCLFEAVAMLWPDLADQALLWGGFWPQLFHGVRGVYPGQIAGMFVTYGFLHAGWLHLGMNMLSLAVLIRAMRPGFSTGQLLLIYALSQIAAAGLFAVMLPDGGPMIGASGAVFGLAGALFGFAFTRARRLHLPMDQIARSAALLVLINLGLTLVLPGIAWQAHLGGALAGLALGALMARG
ncbi:MAG: rhomboid family intramembrane serine protease [Paracoccus sp. (in: a-proteobacteria)]|uniref:rhomboid family intramembrane serine protease n=1 Tax=Paracoccus sp. TaxID=267 RepID=UPI0026E09691|nr:rhomboid family intramembrane serine protease [Paracoccus sp. (in: a-proteobacteria)]MDO5621472.1 rhomboid family intramembrane serine protease [Paracoccus sp. (in: a-proteobacteria)]